MEIMQVINEIYPIEKYEYDQIEKRHMKTNINAKEDVLYVKSVFPMSENEVRIVMGTLEYVVNVDLIKKALDNALNR